MTAGNALRWVFVRGSVALILASVSASGMAGAAQTPPIEPAPAALVEHGRIHTGFFAAPVRRVNLLEANNLGGESGRAMRHMRLKEWVGFTVNSPEIYGAMIIQDAKYASSGTLYLYDKVEKRFYEWLVVDWPWRVQLPETLWQGQSRARGRAGEMLFEHALEAGYHRATLRLKAHGDTPQAAVDVTFHEDLRAVEPLVVSLPIGQEHHTYTHKAPLRLAGQVRVGDRVYTFDPARDLGNLDEQKTFYPYRSAWMWGTFAAPSVEGREVMINFVDQMTPEDMAGEDALWVDGQLELITQPTIIAEPQPGHFRIESADGRVRLTFVPEGSKDERRNYGLIAMDYQQFYGRYNGTIMDAAGTVHHFDAVFGVLERMQARF